MAYRPSRSPGGRGLLVRQRPAGGRADRRPWRVARCTIPTASATGRLALARQQAAQRRVPSTRSTCWTCSRGSGRSAADGSMGSSRSWIVPHPMGTRTRTDRRPARRFRYAARARRRAASAWRTRPQTRPGARDATGFIDVPEPGDDSVSIHWSWACDRLDGRQLTNLVVWIRSPARGRQRDHSRTVPHYAAKTSRPIRPSATYRRVRRVSALARGSRR